MECSRGAHGGRLISPEHAIVCLLCGLHRRFSFDHSVFLLCVPCFFLLSRRDIYNLVCKNRCYGGLINYVRTKELEIEFQNVLMVPESGIV